MEVTKKGMKMIKTPFTPEEMARRGRAIYERIRSEVEPGNAGKVLVIDLETGDYEMDSDHLTASNSAAAKHPGAPLYAMRIGAPSLGRIGGRLSPRK